MMVVGRDAELEQTTALLERSGAPAVMLSGQLGVGKTHLAEAVARRWERGDRSTRWASATVSATEVPLGAFSPLVETTSGARTPVELLERARQDLTADAPGHPTLIVVDDAHLLDALSLTLVQQLAADDAVRLLLTLRSAEPTPRTLAHMWKEGLAEQVEVGPLDRTATDELVRAVLGGPAGDLLLDSMWQRTEGNPLYVRELLRRARADGHVARENGRWQQCGPLAPSERLVQIVSSRLAGLDELAQRAAQTVAISEPIALDVLEDVTSLDALEALEEAELIRIERSRRRQLVRFEHPVYGEAVRAALPTLRTRRLIRSLGEALRKAGARRRGDFVQLGRWALQVGERSDADLLVAAANEALGLFDAPLAERLARAAIDADGGWGAELALGRAISLQNRPVEAEEALAALGTSGPDDRRAQVALARGENLFFRAARHHEALEVVREALDAVEDVSWQTELESSSAMFSAMLGDLPAAADAGDRVLGRGDIAARATVSTLTISTMSQVMLGRLQRARPGIDVALDLAPRVRDELPLAHDLLLINRMTVDAYSGRLHTAEEQGRRGYAAAVERGAPEAAGVWAACLPLVLLLRGLISDAGWMAERAIELLERSDAVGLRPAAVSLAATSAAMAGDPQGADRWLARLDDLGARLDLRNRVLRDRARGWVMAASGQLAAAAEHAVAKGREAADATHHVWAAVTLYDAVRFGHARVALSALEDVASEIDGDLVPAFVAHARAQIAREAREIDQVSRRFEEMGAMLLAAEAAAQAASLHRADGRSDLGRRVATRAQRLTLACGPHVRTPAVALEHLPLTRREREVALLAARGLSSADIAERLTLSVRTVDNHLGSVYRKLDIGGRDELSDLIAPAATDAPTSSG